MILLELFITFLKIGLFTFGGGYAMIPLINSEVLSKGWMTAEQLVDFIAVSESTPGPFAVNISTYIGMETAGVLGAVCATLGVVLPSFIILLIIAKFVEKFRKSTLVEGIFRGIKPGAVGLLFAAVISIGSTTLFPTGINTGIFGSPLFYVTAFTFILTFLLSLKKVNPILLICMSAVIGIAAGYSFNL
ncbi:MAG: chromate transporter [Lachnospiraceae bacterium]|nr:chromate transporter [Lachnospiraceae bacterium]